MSIDATIRSITITRTVNGFDGILELMDRPPARKGDHPGIAGQRALHFKSPFPPDVTLLVGLDIWGGDSTIMLGRERQIAKRTSWTKIEFIVDKIQE